MAARALRLIAVAFAVATAGFAVSQAGSGPVRIARTMHSAPISTASAPIRTAAAGTAPDCNPDGGPCDMQYYGGHVIPNVKVYVVFWEPTGKSVDTATKAGIADFFRATVNSEYMDWLTEYRTDISVQAGDDAGSPGTLQLIGRGTFAGPGKAGKSISPANTSTSLNDFNGDIWHELDAQIVAGNLPPPDEHSIYMIYFPPGFHIVNDARGSASCQVFCAYHSTYRRPSNGQSVFYGVMPDLGPGGCNSGCGQSAVPFKNLCSASSHELIEAVTDPEVGIADVFGPPLGWYDNVSMTGEVGDMCNQHTDTIASVLDGGTYTVQQIYSQRAYAADPTAGCVAGRTETDDFAVLVENNTASIKQGTTIPISVLTDSTAGSPGTVTLTFSGLPSGVTGLFDDSNDITTTVTPGDPAKTLTLTATGGATISKDVVLVIKAAAGAPVHTASVLLQVTSGANDFGISVAPASQVVQSLGSAQYTVTTTVASGAAESVALSASGLPALANAVFNPTSVTAGGTSMLTITAGNNNVAATTFTVKGTSTTQTAGHSATAQLKIDGPTRAFIDAPANGATVSGNVGVQISGTAGLQTSLSTLVLQIDNEAPVTSTTSPLNYTWDTASESNGSHTILATATDADGFKGTASITVTVSNMLATNDFTLALAPATRTVLAGGSATYALTRNITSGTSEILTLSVLGLPPGATALFNPPSPLAAGVDASTLTVTAGSTTIPAHTFTVKGVTSSVSSGHTTTAQVQIDGLPTVAITAPLDGASVKGNVTVSATAAAGDNTTLPAGNLVLSLDGAQQTTGTASASFAWNTTALTNGSSHVITAVATDADGGQRTATATVTVNNPVITNDFTIALTPSKRAITAGGAGASFNINTNLAAGSAESIALSVTGLPAGVTPIFSPSSVTAGTSATLTLSAPANTTPGSATFTVKGTTTSIPAGHTATATVMVAAKPTVSITAPIAGTVTGQVNVTATAAVDANALGVSKLEIREGNNSLGMNASASLTVAWDTTQVSNGLHTLTATVTDGLGNAVTSPAVSVTVSNGTATDFSLSLPAGTVSLNAGGDAVQLTISTAGSGSPPPINLSLGVLPAGVTGSFSPNPVTAGQTSTLTLMAAASTAPASGTLTVSGSSGGITRSATAGLSVSGAGKLAVVIGAPADGAQVSGTVQLSATATPTAGATLSRIDFLVDDAKIGTATSSPGSISWDTSAVAVGQHTLIAKAFDSTGASGTASISIQVQRASTGGGGGGCSSSGSGAGALAALLALGALAYRRRRA